MSNLRKLIDQLFSGDRPVSYRRLLAFAVTCGLLVSGHVSESTWLYVAMIFIGVEGAQKIAEVAMAKAKALPDKAVGLLSIPAKPSDEPKP